MDELPPAYDQDINAREVAAGALVYGQTLGPALSSARQEAIALYAGLAVPGAQKYGVDNQSTVLRLQTLLKANTKPRKPWGLQDDGDVWQAIEKAVITRGREATEVENVKGHATNTHSQWRNHGGEASWERSC